MKKDIRAYGYDRLKEEMEEDWGKTIPCKAGL